MSVWYESGTVSLTNGSSAVTGAGTNFKTVGLIAAGDVFVIDGKFYQVASVADDGNLTLASNYAGTTGTNKTYAVIRMQSVSLSNSALAAQVAQLLASWQGREDEIRAWLAGTAGGGANSDGKYPLTDATGATYQVRCPAQMQADTNSAVETIAGGGMDGVFASSATGMVGKIPATKTFELWNNTGTQKHLSIDEEKGLRGIAGNISSPLCDIQLNQDVKTPFYSDDFTVASAAAPVVDYPSLRTCQITLTGGAKAGVTAGQYAEIGAIYYPIIAVTGALLTLEYDFDVADPVAGIVYVNTWKFYGKYAGVVDYARSARHHYFDKISGLMRTKSAGFPAFQCGSGGRLGFVRSMPIFNALTTTNWRTAAKYLPWGVATGTVVANVAGIDGATNAAITLTDTDVTKTYAAHCGVISITADTATHTIGHAVLKTAVSSIVGLTAALGGGAVSVSGRMYLDTNTGQISADSDPTAQVRDAGLFWWVTLSVTNNDDGTGTTGNINLRNIVYPSPRASLNGGADLTTTGSCVVDYPVVALNATVIENPVMAQVSSLSDKFEFQGVGNCPAVDADITVSTEFEIYGVSPSGNDRILDGSNKDFWLAVASTGSPLLRDKIYRRFALVGTVPTLNTEYAMIFRKDTLTNERFLNSALDVSGAFTATTSPSNTVMAIGHNNGNASASPFTGIIYRVRIWDKRLNDMDSGAA